MSFRNVARSAGLADGIVDESQKLVEQWRRSTRSIRHDSAARALLEQRRAG